ncbi:MAG: hypothetical protein HYT03_01110 [Candidatus Harrisonbacteria bacterium]|nr:hypothetical protein [Candidatus Harrisonbacteria bacterium]
MKIEFLDKKDRSLLEQFYRESYSPKYILLRKDFFDWYTVKNPNYRDRFPDGQLPVLVLRDDKRILAHWVCGAQKFNFFGRNFSMFWTSNWMVHPDFRHRGLGALITNFLQKLPVDVLAANMVTKESRNVLERLNYQYQDLNRYLAVFSDEALNLVNHRNDPRVRDRLREVIIPAKNGDFANIEPVSAFAEDYNEFWHSGFAPVAQGGARDADFLNWRYPQAPFFEYRCFVVKDNQKKIKGVIVLRIDEIRNTNYRACRMLEFFTDPEWAKLAAEFVISYARREKCVFLDYYNLFSGFDSFFAEAGILKNDSVLSTEIPRLTQPVAHENWFINAVFWKRNPEISNETFFNFDKWYTTSGDSDQDRKNF